MKTIIAFRNMEKNKKASLMKMLNILIDIRNLLVYNISNVLYTIECGDFNMFRCLNIE